MTGHCPPPAQHLPAGAHGTGLRGRGRYVPAACVLANGGAGRGVRHDEARISKQAAACCPPFPRPPPTYPPACMSMVSPTTHTAALGAQLCCSSANSGQMPTKPAGCSWRTCGGSHPRPRGKRGGGGGQGKDEQGGAGEERRGAVALSEQQGEHQSAEQHRRRTCDAPGSANSSAYDPTRSSPASRLAVSAAARSPGRCFQ